jgi:hypothetical protein
MNSENKENNFINKVEVNDVSSETLIEKESRNFLSDFVYFIEDNKYFVLQLWEDINKKFEILIDNFKIEFPVNKNIKYRLFHFSNVLWVILAFTQFSFCDIPFNNLELSLLVITFFHTISVNEVNFALSDIIQKTKINVKNFYLKRFIETSIVFGVFLSVVLITNNSKTGCRNKMIIKTMRSIVLVQTIYIYHRQKNLSFLINCLSSKLFDANALSMIRSDEVDFNSSNLKAMKSLVQYFITFDLFCLTILYVSIYVNEKEFLTSFSVCIMTVTSFCITIFANIQIMIEVNDLIKKSSKSSFNVDNIRILGWKIKGDLILGYCLGLLFLGLKGFVSLNLI